MKLQVTVHGIAYEVDVEVLDAGQGFPSPPLPTRLEGMGAMQPAQAAAPAQAAHTAAPASAVAAPIAGVVNEVKCKVGDTVSSGQTLIVVEAMKMLTNITAPGAAKVKKVSVSAGDSVTEGQVLVELDA